jgi:hypothetical protein
MTAPKLPPLPNRVYMAWHRINSDSQALCAKDYFDEDQMHVYALAVRAQALEEAANVCNSLVLKQPHRSGCEACYRCEEAIRELKEKA